MTPMRTSIHGRRFGLGDSDELVGNELPLTSPTVDADIAIASSQTSPRDVTVQLKTGNGAAIKEPQSIELLLLADEDGLAFATTGGSTGIADDGNAGDSLAIVAKKVFHVRTDATGKWSGTWTDSAHEVAYLGVRLPNGRVVISDALTTA